MNFRLSLLASSLVLAAAAAAGCYTGSAVDSNAVPTVSIGKDPTVPGNEDTLTDDDDDDDRTVTAKNGLPCDVAVLLKASCGQCHGTKRSEDAPLQIATYDDLVTPSVGDPTKTIAERSLARMKSSKSPMPPDGKLGTDEVEILEKWINDGMPKGSCGVSNDAKPDAGTKTPKKDAGSHSSSGDPDPDPDPLPPPTSVCTSGVTAPPGTGPLMRPGKACISCHTSASGPSFTAAGTVFPTKHEPDNCNGSNGPATAMKVLIIDANGAMRALPVNAAGNFSSNAVLPSPYRAIVVRGNSIREMKSTQTDGDCNHCHTEMGSSGAPGRIMEP